MMSGHNGPVRFTALTPFFAKLTPGYGQIDQSQHGATNHQARCNVESQVFLAGDIFHHAGNARQNETTNAPGGEHYTVVEAK